MITKIPLRFSEDEEQGPSKLASPRAKSIVEAAAGSRGNSRAGKKARERERERERDHEVKVTKPPGD